MCRRRREHAQLRAQRRPAAANDVEPVLGMICGAAAGVPSSGQVPALATRSRRSSRSRAPARPPPARLLPPPSAPTLPACGPAAQRLTRTSRTQMACLPGCLFSHWMRLTLESWICKWEQWWVDGWEEGWAEGSHDEVRQPAGCSGRQGQRCGARASACGCAEARRLQLPAVRCAPRLPGPPPAAQPRRRHPPAAVHPPAAAHVAAVEGGGGEVVAGPAVLLVARGALRHRQFLQAGGLRAGERQG